MLQHCSFCVEDTSGQVYDPVLSTLGMPSFARFIWRDDDFFLIPSLGPLADNHLLLVTRKHHDALRDAPDDLRIGMIKLIATIKQKLANRLQKNIMIFENGEALTRSADSSCIAHVHVHFVPLSDAEHQAVLNDPEFPNKTAKSWNEALTAMPADADYMLVQASDETYLHCSPKIPSQTMRKIIARHVAAKEWNWRDAPGLDRVKAIAETLGPVFADLRG